MVWDVSEPYLKSAAYVDLFRLMDIELKSFKENPDSAICALLKLARNGNPEACEAILCYLRNRLDFFQEIDVTSAFRLVEQKERVFVQVPSLEAEEIELEEAAS